MSTTPPRDDGRGPADGLRVVGVPTEPGDSEVDAWADAAVSERLPRLRAVAAEWQKTVGTVAGLLGAGTLLNADTAVGSLSPAARNLFALAAGIAFTAAAASIVLASLAAQPRIQEIPPGVVARRAARDEAFVYARRRLVASRWCAGIALVALLASFGVRWYA
ncbi:hypothetical protein J1G42_14550 [Cellulomonas sp. zg-ZUI222]|uniref:DUF1772 domain-containing protein n=1 Tax=Cellulomonas wangleii TaxID=2816956 RepID=A0ABX8D9K8_9CELL|nr:MULTISPECIES: hypothetical protein [Cellulomonas]MBO0901802.1 hypothetical protein [Cellulomonas sp. zg-ZUI22]MBO0922041.1 hypothetical protein [Cellulomonas wangleii]MBO0926241.1 hypothetical protein [Cellulomonas wangleii]QVI62747.1 hypothetical protein KG103_02050 [Cellulomonas wangleii]